MLGNPQELKPRTQSIEPWLRPAGNGLVLGQPWQDPENHRSASAYAAPRASHRQWNSGTCTRALEPTSRRNRTWYYGAQTSLPGPVLPFTIKADGTVHVTSLAFRDHPAVPQG